MNMKYSIAIITLTLILASCTVNPEDKGSKTELLNFVYNEENLEHQKYTIDTRVDNIIEGDNGTKIKIKKESFVDTKGNVIKDTVTISLIEALDPLSMVMGNLTTTYDGQPLESGGMIQVIATFNGENLELAANKNLLVAVPSDTLLPGMSIFEGARDTVGSFNWFNPVPIDDPSGVDLEDTLADDIQFEFEKSHNIKYLVEGFEKQEDQPIEVRDEVSRIAWEGAGLKINADSSLMIDTFEVKFFKQDTLTFWRQEFNVNQGTNTFITDQNLSYVFQMKKLGWANIDRLLDDPRTTDVDLFVNVKNHEEFNFVYATMITKNMYLPGYQKADNTYSFAHGDYEKPRLPVGEKATIIVTASKGGKTYFDFQTIEIAESQKVELNLNESSKTKIEKTLEESL